MAEVTKDERVLLVVANLVLENVGPDGGKYQWLYEWLDKYAVVVANLLMRPVYRVVESLTHDQVTLGAFFDRVVSLATDPQTKALDVFLVMHGLEGELAFDDVSVRTAELRELLKAADLADRLRLLYSTACHGASHAADFVDAGFCTASGARAICANGPYEFPTQLLKWRNNQTYKSSVKAGDNPVFRLIHDHAAKLMGFTDVNSEKVIVGKKLTRITSPAT
ncbi:MAG: hypothetical protein KGY78_06445 [Anaerolineae bacterium]|nr:hypothetical protein [Anaerolineae bacterium]